MAEAVDVAVVDYGMGNLRSVTQAVLRASEGQGLRVACTSDADAVRAAGRVVLPGQGAMRDCMAALGASGLREAVLEAAASKPLLGVCVGLQMLLEHSEEQDTPGLGLLPGRVMRFPEGGRDEVGGLCKVPQIGWNRVAQRKPHALWQGVPDGAWFYFVHSYHAVPADPRDVAGETSHGLRFTSAVARDNIFATQFHPEKSAAQGIALFRNFLHWKP